MITHSVCQLCGRLRHAFVMHGGLLVVACKCVPERAGVVMLDHRVFPPNLRIHIDHDPGDEHP